MAVYSRNNLQLFLLVAALLFFLAGAVRGASSLQSLWLKGLLVDLGGALPVLVIRAVGMSFTEHGYVPLFLASSFLLAVTGVQTRRLLSQRRLGTASLLAALSFAVLILALTTAVPSLMARWSSVQVDRPAPSLSFVTLDGRPVTSASLSGRVVILAFWATWCSPCQQELPELQKLYEQIRNNPNVAFYVVGGPWGGDTVEAESDFARQKSFALPFAFDSQGAAKALGVHSFPTLIILDGAGHVRMIHKGYDASEHLGRRVSKELHTLMGN
jgi:thiol-disulfide isomerase/thioredoxin